MFESDYFLNKIFCSKLFRTKYLFLICSLRLQAAAGTKLAEIKEKSALGMQHIIEEHKRLELKIDMMASYIVIPHSGFYRKYDILNCKK